MNVFESSLQKSGKNLSRPIVAIGNFDGVHLGHRHIFQRTADLAKELDTSWAAMTFRPHPAKVLAPELAPQLITTFKNRLALIEESGPDGIIVLPFNQELASLTPEEYVQEILVNSLNVSGVVVGYDFTFGKNRQGNRRTIKELGNKFGFETRIISPFSIGGITVSSTKIRAFVLSGRVYAASMLLGRPLVVSGEVVHGDGRGATLGYPTANMDIKQELRPSPGVYAAWCTWEENHFPAAVNIGSVPTFKTKGDTSVEAYILDWSGDLYGENIQIEFVRRLRPEVRYDSAKELIEQIKRDVLCTREILMKL